MNFDISEWDKRNVGVLPSGELCVRESLEDGPFTLSSASNVIRGWSVKCQSTDITWHYLLWSDVGTPSITLYILDENEAIIQIFTYGTSIIPRDVTLSIVEDQLMICSPDLPMVWGVVGSGVVLATSEASVNTMTTALTDIPQGIAVSWAGRNVIATRETMFFSDALYPRTYVGQNSIDPPGGSIYGLHVNAQGALIVCTTSGVYALPEDAAASGQIVIGIFSKLTDYECLNYRTTASCKGYVYGLTRKGFRRIDVPGSDEVFLDEKVMSVKLGGGRLFYSDYKAGKIYGAADGVIVHMGDSNICITDFSAKTRSWWTLGVDLPLISSFAGTGVDDEGKQLFFSYALLRLNGNNSSVETSAISGSIFGRILLPPETSPVVRHVTFASDSYQDFVFSIRETAKSITPKYFAPVIGVNAWGDSAYIEPRLQSRQSSWGLRGDDLTFVLTVKEHPYLIPGTIDVEFKGPGKKRPTN